MTIEGFGTEFFRLIAKYRKLSGISQRRMQDETGIHIGRIEAGTYCPSLKTYFRVCEYLKLPLCMIMEEIDRIKKSEQ